MNIINSAIKTLKYFFRDYLVAIKSHKDVNVTKVLLTVIFKIDDILLDAIKLKSKKSPIYWIKVFCCYLSAIK